MRVRGIDAQGVAFARGYELRPGDAEGSISAGIAEVPGELHAGDIYLEGGGVGSGVAGCRPEALCFNGERGEEEGEGREREILDAPETRGLGSVAAGKQAKEEDEMGQRKEGKGNPEVEQKVAIESRAVGAGVSGESPKNREQERRLLEDRSHSSG